MIWGNSFAEKEWGPVSAGALCRASRSGQDASTEDGACLPGGRVRLDLALPYWLPEVVATSFLQTWRGAAEQRDPKGFPSTGSRPVQARVI